MIMNYREVEGIDENGNPTTFKIELPSAKEELKGLVDKALTTIKNGFQELQKKSIYRAKEVIEKELDEGEKAKEVLGIIKPFLKNLRLEQNEKGEYEVLIDVINSDKPLIIARLKTETEFDKIRKEVLK